MMMNILALGLVLTSLAAAGFWSPTREKPAAAAGDGEQVIVKEGHRVVVVEYESQGDTRVLISPDEAVAGAADGKTSEVGGGLGERGEAAVGGAVEHAKEKLKEAASVLPNLGQGLSPSAPLPHPDEHGGAIAPPRARELICDSLGKCAHKISGVIGRGKGKASEAAHEAWKNVQEAGGDAKELAWEAYSGAKEAAKEALEKAKERGGEAATATVEKGTEQVKEAAAQKAHYSTKEGAEHEVERVGKGIAGRNVVEEKDRFRKQAVEKVRKAREAEEKAREAEEKAREAAEGAAGKARSDARKLEEEGEEKMRKILRRGREAAFALFPVVLETVMSTVQLLGFCSAYGMGVWVTFVSSYALARALPRQQFAVVQSKIYPVYFKAMGYGVGMALIGHVVSQRGRLWVSKAEMLQCYNLGTSLLMLVANLMYLEPKATKVMFERMKVEKEEGRGRDNLTEDNNRMVEPQQAAGTAAAALVSRSTSTTVPERPEPDLVKSRMIELNAKLRRLNTQSSFLNILTLMALTWHLVYLTQCLHVTC